MQVLVLAVLGILHLAGGALTKVSKQTYFMQLSVEKSFAETQKALDDMEALLKVGKEKKVGKNVMVMLRTGAQKLKKFLRDLEQKKKKEEARAAKAASLVVSDFTTDKEITKPLKASMGLTDAKCNIMKYASLETFKQALNEDKVNFKFPFIVSNAANNLDVLQKTWNSKVLKQDSDTRFRYYAPHLAKLMLAQGGEGESMEVYQPEMIGFSRYFASCFGQKKTSGTETDHCEQVIPAVGIKLKGSDGAAHSALRSVLDTIGGSSAKIAEGVRATEVFEGEKLKYAQALEAARKSNVKKVLPSQADALAQLRAGINWNVVMGSSGSGSPLREQQEDYFDALIHGARRWMIMDFQTVKRMEAQSGKRVSSTSAFNWFESQLNEYVEDHDLDLEGSGVWQCSQRAGDVIFSPSNLVNAYLSLSDSLSYRRNVVKDPGVIAGIVNQHTWFPRGQVWNLGVCYPRHKLRDLPGLNMQQVQMLAEGLENELDTPQLENSMMYPVLTECHSALAVANDMKTRKGKNLSKSDSKFMKRVVGYCESALELCGSKLARNILTVNSQKDYWPNYFPKVESIDLEAIAEDFESKIKKKKKKKSKKKKSKKKKRKKKEL